jgi:hypothetical protein
MYRAYNSAGDAASSRNEEDDDLYSGYNDTNEDEVVYGNVSSLDSLCKLVQLIYLSI